MVHRYIFIATAFVSSLNSIESAGLRSPIASEDATGQDYTSKDNEPDWVKAGMTVEKGFKCNSGADKRKMAGGRECEGGFKQTVTAQLAPKELAENVVAAGILDLRSSMMQPDSQNNLLLPPEETMDELMRWDTERDLVFEGEDCSEESGGCKKTLEFGGYAKVFWGCNITFSMKGKKVGKDVECGGKSFEGAGGKPKDSDKGSYYSYFGDDESGSAEAPAKTKSYATVPGDEGAGNAIAIAIAPEFPKRHLSAYNMFFRDERAKILAAHERETNSNTGVGDEEQARIISQRWKELECETREAYEKFAEADAIRYTAEMELYIALTSPKPKPPLVELKQQLSTTL